MLGFGTIISETSTGDHIMGPNGLRKAAYVALIVLLFGVSSGWLGGL